MNKLAFKAVERARTQLIVSQPFFGCLALQLEVVEIQNKSIMNTFCNTMAVDGVRMFYWPEFVLSLTEEELIGVIAHEILHCAYRHFSRRGSRDPLKWNYACVKAGTLITTLNGKTPIEKVNAGDLLKTPLGLARVITVATSRKKVLELDMSNGYKLCCSYEHGILTNEGFVKAGEIKKGATILVDKCPNKNSLRNSKRALTTRNSNQNRLHLPTSGIGDKAPCAQRSKNILGEKNIPHCGTINQPSSGLLGRHHRRRGDNLILNEVTKDSALCPAIRGGNNYQSEPSLLAGISWLQGSDKTATRKPEVLLELCDIRVQSGCVVDLDITIFGNKKTARRMLNQLYSTEKSTAIALRDFTRNAEASGGIEGFECARVTAITKVAKEAICYDLTTDKHCYVADGVVVHNCDYIINDDLLKVPFVLPKQRLHDPKYSGMSAEEVYERLPDPPKMKITITISGDGDGQQLDPTGCGGVIDPQGQDDKGNSSGKVSAEAIAAEWDANVRLAINVARAQNAGKLPGHLERLAGALQAPKVNWRDLTQQFIDQSMTKDYAWSRPNRRFLSTGLILPGQVPDSLHHLVGCIDTSGSISDELIRAMVSEMFGALNQGVADKLTIIYADAAVEHVDEFTPGDPITIPEVRRGGTDFADTFRWIKANAPDASCIVYLTDMMTSAWGEEPTAPVLWAAYSTDATLAQYVPPFGDVIKVDSAY